MIGDFDVGAAFEAGVSVGASTEPAPGGSGPPAISVSATLAPVVTGGGFGLTFSRRQLVGSSLAKGRNLTAPALHYTDAAQALVPRPAFAPSAVAIARAPRSSSKGLLAIAAIAVAGVGAWLYWRRPKREAA